MKPAWIAIAACACLSAFGCGYNPHFRADVVGIGDLPHQRPGLPPIPDAAELPRLPEQGGRPPYRIGALDRISVMVWGRPDLGSQVPAGRETDKKITTVAADGTIALPFLERIEVEGLTVVEAARAVEEAYARSVPAPQVEIVMVEYRSKQVYIDGAVARPGVVFLRDDLLTVGEAIAAAGGPSEGADTRNAILVRDGVAYHLDDWGARRGQNDALDVLLEDGDKIYFPPITERVFYVLGDVMRQGAFPIPDEGVTLVQGLAAAGGPNLETAKLRPITLIRVHGEETTVYKFDLEDALESGDIPLFPGDRLYVSRAGIWHWGNVWRQMVPFVSLASAAWFIDRLFSE